MFKWETTKAGEVVVKRIFNDQTSFLFSHEAIPGHNIAFIKQELLRLDELRVKRRHSIALSEIMQGLGIYPTLRDFMIGYGAKKGEMRVKIRKRRNLDNQYIITFYGLRDMNEILHKEGIA